VPGTFRRRPAGEVLVHRLEEVFEVLGRPPPVVDEARPASVFGVEPGEGVGDGFVVLLLQDLL